MGRSNLIIQHGINLPDLYLYAFYKHRALKKRKQHADFIDKLYSAIRKYELDYQELLDKLADVQRQIQYLTKGVPSGPLDTRTILDVEDGESSDQTRRFLCRRFYRELAQKFHPDKGGNVDQFQALKDAYSLNDLEYLRIQYSVFVNESSIGWRCREGKTFWQETEQSVQVRLHRLQATELWSVARFHMTGQYEKASHAMGVFLKRKYLARTAELQFLISGVHNGKTRETEEKEGKGRGSPREEVEGRQET